MRETSTFGRPPDAENPSCRTDPSVNSYPLVALVSVRILSCFQNSCPDGKRPVAGQTAVREGQPCPFTTTQRPPISTSAVSTPTCLRLCSLNASVSQRSLPVKFPVTYPHLSALVNTGQSVVVSQTGRILHVTNFLSQIHFFRFRSQIHTGQDWSLVCPRKFRCSRYELDGFLAVYPRQVHHSTHTGHLVMGTGQLCPLLTKRAHRFVRPKSDNASRFSEKSIRQSTD